MSVSMIVRMLTSAQVVETSISVITNSPSQDSTRRDDYTSTIYETIK